MFTSLFGNFLFKNKPQQKDKNKEKTAKTVESKDREKTVSFIKVDTSKSKLQNSRTETDTVNKDNYFTFKPYKKNAHASYYHNKFNGRRTASGLKFDNSKLTAAHKKLPFGTIVRVTNEANGKSVIVQITDRGPFSKVREIDLTRKAFMDIASNKNSGVLIVTLEIIEAK
jgi:rare lipoprotein A